jgi:hypothetical protein
MGWFLSSLPVIQQQPLDIEVVVAKTLFDIFEPVCQVGRRK